jgi:hypothetical protein
VADEYGIFMPQDFLMLDNCINTWGMGSPVMILQQAPDSILVSEVPDCTLSAAGSFKLADFTATAAKAYPSMAARANEGMDNRAAASSPNMRPKDRLRGTLYHFHRGNCVEQ